MKTSHNKATPRACHTLRQVVQRIPRWLIERTANAHGVDARRFSATSPFVMPVLGHLSRASCLTEICDDADLNRGKLRLVRNATPGRRNTFSYANRARPAEVAEEVYWVLRQKDGMRYEVAESREASGDILSDETVRLTAADTAKKHSETLRRVRALVEVDGEEREMTFLTNNTKWAARTVCELYRARWAVEVFFREIKQTLQLADFIGTNENAVRWQIWTGLLTHLLLHYLKFLSGWDKAFSRLAGIVRSAVWMDVDIVETLRLYGTASPPRRPRPHCIQQRLAGF